MNKFTRVLAALVPIVLAGNALGAVEIQFDFRGDQGTRDSLTFSQGVEVTVKGFVTDAETPVPVKVHQDSRGLSVVDTTNDPEADPLMDTAAVSVWDPATNRCEVKASARGCRDRRKVTARHIGARAFETSSAPGSFRSRRRDLRS